VIQVTSYDVLNDTWVKLPFALSLNFDPDVHFAYLEHDLKNMFQKIDLALGELRREVIDFNIIEDYINQLDDNEKMWLQDKLQKKIEQIESTIQYLITQKDQYHQLRKSAYTDTDEETAWADAVRSKSWKPQNIMWKMLDRYKYIKTILSLQKILKQSDNDLSVKDVNKIDNIVKFKEQFTMTEARNIKLYRKRWKDPMARHAMVMARGAGRKFIHQIPQYDTLDRFDKAYPYAEDILKKVKKSQTGIWRITKRTLAEIAEKYGLKIPSAKDPFKKLGRANIILWYKQPKFKNDSFGYYLIKNKILTDKYRRRKGRKRYYPKLRPK